jgi:hypothetical protein
LITKRPGAKKDRCDLNPGQKAALVLDTAGDLEAAAKERQREGLRKGGGDQKTVKARKNRKSVSGHMTGKRKDRLAVETVRVPVGRGWSRWTRVCFPSWVQTSLISPSGDGDKDNSKFKWNVSVVFN